MGIESEYGYGIQECARGLVAAPLARREKGAFCPRFQLTSWLTQSELAGWPGNCRLSGSLCAEQEIRLASELDRMEGPMVLHGWKQIAQYLGCGIRTAQRWESECKLPVTRPRNHLRSPVLANSETLDAWARGVSVEAAGQWEPRLARLEREIESLKRQLILLGAEPVPGVPERDRGRPAGADGQRQVAVHSPGFDA